MLRYRDWLIAVFLIYYFISSILISGVRVESAQVLALIPIVVIYYFSRFISNKVLFVIIISFAVFNLCWMCIELISKLLTHCADLRLSGFFKSSGSCGGLQAIGVLSAYYSKNSRIGKILIIFLMISVFMTGSRAAMMAVIIPLLIVGHGPLNNIKTITYSLGFVVLLSILIIIRPESVVGRLMVWSISLSMLKSSFFTGIGAGGFSRNYMFQQADFFKNGCHSDLSCYAQDIIYPFNEFIRVFVELGFVGLLLVLAILFISLKDGCTDVRRLILSSSIFSFFSFPFNVPLLLLLYILIMGSMPNDTSYAFVPFKIYSAICLISLGMAIMLFLNQGFIKSMIYQERYWNSVSAQRLRNDLKQNFYSTSCASALSYYLQLHQEEMTEEDHYLLFPVSDNILLIGDYYYNRNQYQMAEKNYWLAYNMVPGDFDSVVSLWRTYKALGNYEQEEYFANRIRLNYRKEGTKGIKAIKELNYL